MASVMQTLFALPTFRSRYSSETAKVHMRLCDNPLPASCLECQMLKLADGLISGRYSHRATTPPIASTDIETQSDPPRFQEGIKPSHFKALIGKGHEEFSTMRQQDSEEFLQHLFARLRTEARMQSGYEGFEATGIVQFEMEQRLQCTECHRVGYRVDSVDLASLPVPAVEMGLAEDGKTLWREVSLKDCLDSLCSVEELYDYACANCGHKVRAVKYFSYSLDRLRRN